MNYLKSLIKDPFSVSIEKPADHIPEWKKEQMFLSMRAKMARKGTPVWLSRDKNGRGLTYVRPKGK